MSNIHTIAQVTQIFKDTKPKHVALKTATGLYEVRYNQPAAGEVEKRFKTICERVKMKTTAPGIYIVAMKDHNSPGTAEKEYAIQIGTPLAQNKPMSYIQDNPQSVVTMAEWMKMLKENLTLTTQLEFEKETVRLLTKKVSELETELQKAETLADNSENSPLKDLSEVFRPLLDVYFEQNDRKLKIEEKKLSLSSPGTSEQKRADGGLLPTDKGYHEYFEDIHTNGTDDDFEYECDFLEKNYPELWVKVKEHYKIEDAEETDEQNTNTGT